MTTPGDLGPIIGLDYAERQALQALANQLPAPTKETKLDDVDFTEEDE